MKKSINLTAVILLSLILSVPVTGHAQELKGWYIGATVQPMKYWQYNKLIWHDPEPNYFEPVALKWSQLNSIAYGLTIDKNFGSHWGIRAELTYVSQKIHYLGAVNAFNKDSNHYALNTEIAGRFRNLKLPVMATYRIPLGSRNDVQLMFRQGVQFSVLLDYRTQNAIPNPPTFSKLPAIIEATPNEVIITNSFITGNPHYSDGGGNGWIYSRFNVGSVTCAGISGKVDDRFTGHRQFYGYAGLRFEYDFTNAENWSNNLGRYNFPGTQVPPLSATKPPSHNIRAGLEFGLSYYLEKHKRR